MRKRQCQDSLNEQHDDKRERRDEILVLDGEDFREIDRLLVLGSREEDIGCQPLLVLELTIDVLGAAIEVLELGLGRRAVDELAERRARALREVLEQLRDGEETPLQPALPHDLD